MMKARYRLAAEHAAEKDLLEVACGAGQGLGMLSRCARRVIAGDYTESLVHSAKAHYGSRVPLLCFDAHGLPFRSGSFDVVLLFEALYYLRWPDRFLAECRRVLRPDGELLLCGPNPEWSGFNPSPFSTRYFSAGELKALIEASCFRVTLFAGFPEERATSRDSLVGLVRHLATVLHLIPHTMRGKELLKRLFYGRLNRLPPELEDLNSPEQLVPLHDPSFVRGYKVIYAVGSALASDAMTR